MKLSIIFALLLVIFVTYSAAQRCVGLPANPSCRGPVNPGHREAHCMPRTMWHYNARTRRCTWFPYLGCGGNNNRWCTRQQCEACRR